MTARAIVHRPFILIHFGAIFASIAAAAAILTAAAAAAPMFRSETGTAAVRIAIGDHANEALTVTKDGPLAADIIDLREDSMRDATASVPGLADPVETLSGSEIELTGTHGTTTAELATRTGFVDHFTVVEGDPATPGVWLPQTVATTIGVSAGGTVTLRLGSRTAREPVAGIYAASQTDPYWAALFAQVGGDRQPATLVPIDRPGFLRIETFLQDAGQQVWTFGLAGGVGRLTLGRAAVLADGLALVDVRSRDPATQLGSVMNNPSVSAPVVDAVRAAQGGQRTVTPPIQTLSLTGELVALFGMIAAGVYGVRRRRIEMRSLDAKGITWIRLWSRCAVEVLLPVATGGAAGWFVTLFAMQRFGPVSVVESDAIRASIGLAVIPSLIAVAVLATVMTISARRHAHESARGLVPATGGATTLWEIPILVLAAASLYEIWTRGTGAVSFEGGQVQVDRLLLLFPVLFMAGLAGLAVRTLSRVLARSRGSETLPVPLYLAVRRVSAAPRVALMLVTASTLAIGVLAYAGTAVTTIRTSTRDKVLVATGADVTASTTGPIFAAPAGQGLTTTNVMRLSLVGAGSSSDARVDVIAVETDSFARVAFWDPAFSSSSLDDLMGALRPTSEPIPAIIVGGDLPTPLQRLRLAGYVLPLRVVGTASAFPGQGRGIAVVVSASTLRSVLESHDAMNALNGADYAAWARGRSGLATAFLVASGADPGSVVVAADRLQTPGFRALAWSFVFMELIGFVTAVMALIGLLLYLQARQRSRELSYGLGRRMGLSGREHRLAVVIEIAGLLFAAYIIATVLALVTTLLIYKRLDPLPSLPPDPMLRAPVTLLAGIGLAILACSLAGAWFVHRRAERAHVGAVLRFAE